MASPLKDPELEGMLNRMHARSNAQSHERKAYFARREKEGTPVDPHHFDDETCRFLADKMVALDHDKGLLCYQLCRALHARRIVEAGTSYGVSTLYLAAALRDENLENGVVIATEKDANKVIAACDNFRAAKLDKFIELREGDLRETLRDCGGPVDFVLIDIWEVALPALRCVSGSLHRGSVVMCDNTADDDAYYADYFDFVNDPVNRFRTMTLPFRGGFELTVRV